MKFPIKNINTFGTQRINIFVAYFHNRKLSQQVAMGTGTGGQSVEDMERVIGAMRRVVERLQSENEALKKKVEKPKTRGEMLKENRLLKVPWKFILHFILFTNFDGEKIKIEIYRERFELGKKYILRLF